MAKMKSGSVIKLNETDHGYILSLSNRIEGYKRVFDYLAEALRDAENKMWDQVWRQFPELEKRPCSIVGSAGDKKLKISN